MTRWRHGTGRVSRFDEDLGLGTIRTSSGEELLFHCTAIADGSRKIEPGARVDFERVSGHLGRWEAACVRER